MYNEGMKPSFDFSQLRFFVTDGRFVLSAHQHPDAANRFIQRVTGQPAYWSVSEEGSFEHLEFLVVNDYDLVYSAHQHPDAAKRFIQTFANPGDWRVTDLAGNLV